MTFLDRGGGDNSVLVHYGVMGMKWGVRKDRNAGSVRKISKNPNPKKYKVWDSTMSRKENIAWNKEHNGPSSENGLKKKGLSNRQKTALKVGAVTAGVILASAGAYTIAKSNSKTNRLNKNTDRLIKQGDALIKRHQSTKSLLSELEIDTAVAERFYPDTFKPDFFKPDRIKFESLLSDSEVDKAVQRYAKSL